MIYLVYEVRHNVRKIRAATMYKGVATQWKKAIEAHLFAEGKTAWTSEIVAVEDGERID